MTHRDITPAVAYLRASNDPTGTAPTIDRQREMCVGLAKSRGLELVEIIEERNFSAYQEKRRPGWQRVLGMVREGRARAVVAWHWDRLTRRPSDLEELVEAIEAAEAKVYTVESGEFDLSTASGRLVARMLGAASRHESERMSERIRLAVEDRAKRGIPHGGMRPFGYTASELEIVGEEADAIRHIVKLLLDGATLKEAADYLNQSGFTTTRGNTWSAGTVKKMLARPRYAGLRSLGDEIVGEAVWPSIMDRDMWERLQFAIYRPAVSSRQSYLLTGLIFTEAGLKMTGRLAKGKRYYQGKGARVLQQQVEDVVVGACLLRLDDAQVPRVVSDGEDPLALKREMDDLAAMVGRGELSRSEWIAMRQPLQDRLVAAENLSFLPSELHEPKVVRERWPNLGQANQRAILDVLIERVVILPDSGPRTVPAVFKPERVAIQWR